VSGPAHPRALPPPATVQQAGKAATPPHPTGGHLDGGGDRRLAGRPCSYMGRLVEVGCRLFVSYAYPEAVNLLT
jgi:hypothetical protein